MDIIGKQKIHLDFPQIGIQKGLFGNKNAI